MKWSCRLGAVGGICCRAGLIAQHDGERVDDRVDLTDASQVDVDDCISREFEAVYGPSSEAGMTAMPSGRR